MFDIEFITSETETGDKGRPELRGRITLGDYAEEFLSSLDSWSRSDYERQWIEAARRLFTGSDRTGFFTSAFQFWWVMWLEGDDVFVHEHLLIEETLREPWDPSDPYRQIEDRYVETEDGYKVSEWHLRLEDMRDFLVRRETQYHAS